MKIFLIFTSRSSIVFGFKIRAMIPFTFCIWYEVQIEVVLVFLLLLLYSFVVAFLQKDIQLSQHHYGKDYPFSTIQSLLQDSVMFAKH